MYSVLWPFWFAIRAELVSRRSARTCAATYWRMRNSRAAARRGGGGARWSSSRADRDRRRDKRTQFCRRSLPATAGRSESSPRDSGEERTRTVAGRSKSRAARSCWLNPAGWLAINGAEAKLQARAQDDTERTANHVIPQVADGDREVEHEHHRL